MTTITHDHIHGVLKVQPSSFPDADDFQLWSEIFLNHPQLSIVEFSLGADRHQLRFNYADDTFNINYEHYSESIWICPEGIQAHDKLASLAQLLNESLG